MNDKILKIRKDFPILSREVNGVPLVYLDNAATTQKPKAVIETLESYYTLLNSNIHRGVHFLSQRSTEEYEAARELVRKFIGAKSTQEIIFTKGTTEGLNLIAQAYGRKFLHPGDEILLTEMEHHSNIVPWQLLCEQTGAKLKVIPITDKGELDLSNLDKFLTRKTKILSVVHISNSLGTVNPVKKLIKLAHECGAVTIVDGAQSIQHGPVDVSDLDCDFFVFSGHKIYGPTGVGVLYGKQDRLLEMPPYQGGGDMIRHVSWDKTTFNELPFKFEAGTPNIAGVIGLAEALRYIKNIGFTFIKDQEDLLLKTATGALGEIRQIKLIGTAKEKSSVLSFIVEGIHAHDMGTILDQEGVAVRAGHHCTQPVMDRFQVPATVRASFAFYNTLEEVHVLVRGVLKALEIFK